MKIAVPTRMDSIDDHFGHCEYYTVFETDNNRVVIGRERVDSPQGCGCKSEIASLLAKMGVTVMIAGNMGNGALNKLNASGIEVIRGCSGGVEEALYRYLNGDLSDSGAGCSSHGEGGHTCSHNH